jgi:hypothetical protein
LLTLLAIGRARDVDPRLVARSGHERLARGLERAGLDLHGSRPARQNLQRVPRADELAGAHAAIDDADRLDPLAMAQLGVHDRGDPGRVDPVQAVELVEVDRLPVGLAGRLHAQHLAPVARPRHRPVAVVPAERRRLLGLEVLGDVLVVEQRRCAVEVRRDEPARHGHREHARQRHAELLRAEPLEPQEGREEHAEDRAAEVRGLRPVLDDRDRVERAEGDRRGDRVAGRAHLRARPEGDERGGAGEQHAAGDERVAHPLVDAPVGHRDRRERLDALPEAGGELVPSAGLEQP